jgi:Putative Ig domain
MQGRKLPAARARLAEWLIVVVMIGGCAGGGSSSTSSTGTIAGSGQSVSGVITTASPTTTVSTIAFQGASPPSATVGTKYSFQPTVSSSSAVVTFAISGQPPWIAFDRNTGALSGTPVAKDEGTTGHIVITASNGSYSTSMTPFTIRVNPATAPSAVASAVLSWAAPTENADGTPITDLAGYRIFYGTNPTELTKSVDVAGARSTTYVIKGLDSGTYYFSIVAYNSIGLGSHYSSLASTVL